MTGPPPVAVLVSDCHFSLEPPSARADRNWLQTQHEHLFESLVAADGSSVPLVIAGDVFDTWNQPVELVNTLAGTFAGFPGVSVFMVPGQHDLPYHDIRQIDRAAIHTLMLAITATRTKDAVCEIVDGVSRLQSPARDGWLVYGAGWGQPWGYADRVSPEVHNDEKVLLVAHQYTHAGTPETQYVGAGVEKSVLTGDMADKLDGYAAAVFGDNHIPWLATVNGTHREGSNYDLDVYNHGCMVRRKSDERKYAPEYGVLFDDGSIVRHKIEAANHDQWRDGECDYTIPDTLHLSLPGGVTAEFVQSVRQLATDERVDFSAAIHRLLGEARLSKAAKKEILALLPDK